MIRRLLPRLLGLAALVALAVLAMPALSRPAEEKEKELGKVSPDLALVPRDALFFMSIRASEVAESITGKATLAFSDLRWFLPRFEEMAGLRMEEVERLTIFARRFGRSGPVFIVRTIKPIDKDKLVLQLRGEEIKAHGKTFHVGAFGWMRQATWLPDDRTAVFSEPEGLIGYLAAIEKAGKTHPLADELKAADGKHSITLGMLPERLCRVIAAEERLREEDWKRPAKDGRFKDGRFKDKEGPFKDNRFKDAKDKFGGDTVAFQKDFGDKDRPFKDKDRDPGFDPDRFKERPLKLGTLDEAFDWFDRYGPGTVGWRALLRCRRALVTVDLDEKEAGGKAAGLFTFASDDEAKDGVVYAEAARVIGRELLPLPLQMGFKGVKSIEAAVKKLQADLREAEVKRDGKTVSVALGAKIDLLPVLLDGMRGPRGRFHGGPGWGDGPPRRKDYREKGKYDKDEFDFKDKDRFEKEKDRFDDKDKK